MPTVNLRSFTSPDADHRPFADQAVRILTAIVNDARFGQLVSQAHYSYTWRTLADQRRVSQTPADIARIIAAGSERGTSDDGVIDLKVEIEPMRYSTLGYVTTGGDTIHSNARRVGEWVRDKDPLSLAAHWLHEWMHVAGFYHQRWRRGFDVAYTVGDIAVTVGRALASPDTVSSVQVLTLGLGYLRASHEDSCDSYAPEPAEQPNESSTTTTSSPVIDMHTHTFNASDLSVEGFLSDVIADTDESWPAPVHAIVRLLAGLVGKAPSAEDELRHLDTRRGLESANLVSVFDAHARAEAQIDDAEFDAALAAEIHRLQRSGDAGDQALYAEIVRESGGLQVLKGAESAGALAATLLAGFGTIVRYIKWVKRLRKYRYDIIEELIRTYGQKNGRVALFLSAHVDFAAWLSDQPKTPHSAQITVSERLVREFPGRIHFLASFDPWRELLAPGQPGGSLYHVQQAVEKYGFVGVKLYPPMGFRAIGNDGLDFSPVKPPNPATFGARLDEALESLYQWAEREDVPVMAHCNNSQASKHGWGERASPAYWANVIKRHPRLRLNLGHFGGQSNLGKAGEWPEQIIKLMAATDSRVFADIGMFNVHNDPGWFALLAAQIAKAPALGEHLMYGSDWMMLAKEKNAEDYFEDFETQLRRVLTSAQADAILGGNAARFLGLSSKDGAWPRLDAYYKANSLAKPTWL